VLALASTPAAAQGEPGPLQQILGTLGIIETPREMPDYRERAPLVVPPSSALIAPRNPGDVSINNPDWPTDHDASRRKAESGQQYRTDDDFYTGRALLPSEVNRGTIAKREQERRNARAQRPEGETAGAEYAAGRERYSPTQLGFKGWGSKKEDTVQFTGEPERRLLTEPPPGLRTPSTDAPYGIVTATPGPPKPPSFFDRTSAHDDPNAKR
jgi:hypothetical protein